MKYKGFEITKELAAQIDNLNLFYEFFSKQNNLLEDDDLSNFFSHTLNNENINQELQQQRHKLFLINELCTIDRWNYSEHEEEEIRSLMSEMELLLQRLISIENQNYMMLQHSHRHLNNQIKDLIRT
jgi:hypothetical protein